MNRLLTVLKTVFLASILMMFTTACNGAAMSAKPGDQPNPPGQAQPYRGGMNNFRDVDDDRLNTTGADAKAQALKDTVKRNINEKRADSVDQYVENYRSGTPLEKRTERFGKDIKRGVEDVADDAKDVTKQGSKTLKRNAEDTSNKIDRTANEAKRNAKSAGDSVARTAEKAKDKLSNNPVERTGAYIQDKLDEAGNAINDVKDSAIENTKQAIDKAA